MNFLSEQSAPSLPWEEIRHVDIFTKKEVLTEMIEDIAFKLDINAPDINRIYLSNRIGSEALNHINKKCKAARAILEKCVLSTNGDGRKWTFTYRIEEVR